MPQITFRGSRKPLIKQGQQGQQVLTGIAWLWHTLTVKTVQPRDLGQYIVADPRICRGRPTFKGTRVTVADVLADVGSGLSWDFICYRWGDGKITKDAIAEAVQLARTAL